MTDSEIVKALECCMDEMGCKKGCPFFDPKSKSSHCAAVGDNGLEKLALDLIARLRAENETLRGVVKQNHLIRNNGKSPLSLIKAEAYKEFAGKSVSKIADVMKHIERNPYDSKDETKGTICGLAHAIGRIKDLLKELAGEGG